MRTLLIGICIFLILIGAGTYAAVRYIQGYEAANQAVENALKPDISITIVEGKRREEIAQQFQQAGICSAADFLAASQGKEGYLFPDTYRFYANTPAADVVAAMYKDFQNRTSSLGITPDEVILASIVEREAENDADRPQIAGVYQNRLNIGMTMGSDPTVQYAKDTLATESNPAATYKYWQPITAAEYQSVKSPYNTYLQTGLPPGPICNPGLKSLEAAQKPAQHEYLYFLYTSAGELKMSKTLQEHVNQE